MNKPKKDPTQEINIDNFKNPTHIKNYKEEVQKVQKEYEDKKCTSNEEKWTRVIETCEEAGKRVLGMKEKVKSNNKDSEIDSLKERRRCLKTNIDGCRCQVTRAKLEEERVGIKKKITQKLKVNEERELDEKLRNLESMKDDTTKYFYVMRNLQNMNRNTKTPMLIKDKEGNTPGSTTEKIKVIEEYFKSTLAPEDMKN